MNNKTDVKKIDANSANMIDIVFQNENFVVCNKPAGVLSVPSRDREDPRQCLGLELQRVLKINVLPVHRLDLEVGGLIIFALNPKAHRIGQEWFQNKSISKKYLATTSHQNFAHWPPKIETDRAVIDVNTQNDFYWKTKIQRGKKRSFESPHGEWAETKAFIESVTADKIVWKLFPLTGKPHQLRLELSRRGFPIHGDILYGSNVIAGSSGISLKAVSLDLNRVSNRLGLPAKIDLPELK